jgi:glycosyltransferase involved in cell wall biosynthesis
MTRTKVAVDLTLMLPAGANGGVKPAILEFIKALHRLPDSEFDFCFFSNALAHSEIEAIINRRDEVICLDSRQKHGTLRPAFFGEKSIDLLYAPFGMIRFPECKVPIISMVVDLLHRDHPHLLPAAERQWRESYFAKMVHAADRFQVISNHTGERLAFHYRVPAEKIFRTYLSIQDRFPATVVPARTGMPFFLYPANFWPHKNHEILLIAYQIYRHHGGSGAWDLVLIGNDNSRRVALQELAARLGIERSVVFKGHVPENELAALFSGASALVFPSLYEGFGIPLLEAMRLGVPVLTSDAGSLPEVVGQAGLLVDPRKPLDLAATMLKVASSLDLQADLRNRGFERARSFSFQTEVTRLADSFVEVASFAKRRTWDSRLRGRFALFRGDCISWSRVTTGRVSRFLRDRV